MLPLLRAPGSHASMQTVWPRGRDLDNPKIINKPFLSLKFQAGFRDFLNDKQNNLGHS